jgi:hypothetical protein
MKVALTLNIKENVYNNSYYKEEMEMALDEPGEQFNTEDLQICVN